MSNDLDGETAGYSDEQKSVFGNRIVNNGLLAVGIAGLVALVMGASLGRFVVWSLVIVGVTAVCWWAFASKGARPIEGRGLNPPGDDWWGSNRH